MSQHRSKRYRRYVLARSRGREEAVVTDVELPVEPAAQGSAEYRLRSLWRETLQINAKSLAKQGAGRLAAALLLTIAAGLIDRLLHAGNLLAHWWTRFLEVWHDR